MPSATPSITLRISKCAQPLTPEDSFRVFDERGGTIGRTEGNDWILPDPTRHISSRHAALHCEEGKFRLVDTSSNGVFLNDNDEPLGRGRAAYLKDGDRLGIGEYEIMVTLVHPILAACSVQQTAAPPPATVHASLAASAVGQAVDPLDLLREAAMPADASLPGANVAAPASPSPSGSNGIGMQALAEDRGFPALESAASEARDPLLLLDEADALSVKFCLRPLDDRAAAPSGVQRDDAPIMSSYFRAPAVEELVPEDWERQELPALDTVPAQLQAKPPRAGATKSMPAVERVGLSSTEGSAGACEVNSPPDLEAALRIFLEGAGLDDALADKLDSARTLDLAGRLLREALGGVRELLLARATLKAGFHVPVTLIAPKDNNPLKFSAGGVTEVVETLLLDRGKAYLSAVEAMREGVEDLKGHQLALVAGVRSCLDTLVEFFDPARIEEVSMRKTAPGLWTNKKAACWDLYRARYDETNKAAQERFHELFGRPFTSAYEEQDRKLTDSGAAPARETRHGVE